MSAPNLREVEWAISKLLDEESSQAGYILLASLYIVRKYMTNAPDEKEPLEMFSMAGSSYASAAAPVSEPFNRKTAEEWVSGMKNSDGTNGQHWTLDQTKQLMAQRKIDGDPVQFYAALNAVYSDFYGVAKKHGVSNIEFFADLAKAWLEDKDAVPDKAAAYYEYVVKH